ncbi:malate synthase [Arthrobacter sp. Hiyo6]|nr:malate synthase [Arthrobacter sp. Hiyo6]
MEELHKRFAGTRAELLKARVAKREQVARTGKLDFLPETKDIREGDWKVAPAPAALQDRRVEMTGPASPAKMAINASTPALRCGWPTLRTPAHPPG